MMYLPLEEKRGIGKGESPMRLEIVVRPGGGPVGYLEVLHACRLREGDCTIGEGIQMREFVLARRMKSEDHWLDRVVNRKVQSTKLVTKKKEGRVERLPCLRKCLIYDGRKGKRKNSAKIHIGKFIGARQHS